MVCNEVFCIFNEIFSEEIKEAIQRFGGVLKSNKFRGRDNKPLDTEGKMHYNTIDALKKFGLI